MKPKAIDFYYFTGTGNTLLVVRAMSEVFREHGLVVNLRRMELASCGDVAMDHVLGLAFPVAVQSTYPLVWEFMRALPQAQGTEAFMVDTLMMYSGAIVGPLRQVLRDKGYRPIAAREIIMPNNFYPLRIDEGKKAKIAKGLEEARCYAQEIIEGRAHWGHIPVLPDLFHALVGNAMVWKGVAAVGRRFVVDKALCTQCRLCERLCPVDNIALAPYPEYGGKCQQCMRCVSFCPTEAIRLPWFRHERYRSVAVEHLLGESASTAPR